MAKIIGGVCTTPMRPTGGGIIVTDDGKGNVTIVASAGVAITDDGNGNVVIK